MAAYAALVSITHIIEQIQHHPRPPISLHNKQIESLTEKVTFLQDFLEEYSINGGSEDADALERRIADAAYAAEDIIESHIVDQIQAGSTSTHGENISGSIEFYQDLQKVIEDMDFIKTEVSIEIKEKLAGFQDQLLHKNSMSAGSSKSPTTGQNTVVGFDDVLIEIMDKLTGQQSNRQIFPIVGMGGIGKTTLARNIYVNPLIKHHFDILAWATISQEYNIRKILLEVVLCIETKWDKENLSQMSDDELGQKLYKCLSGRRYLILMDDIWSIEAWDKVKFFFPDNNNGSRIMITSRLSNLAFQLSGSNHIDMKFLDEYKSWNLLCKSIFGEEDCPIELEEIGKKIAKNCKGLPLSIVVIGGLLAKSQRTREHWEYIADNLNSIVNLEDGERCLKILHMSYKQLPVHLKPCFLYMGVFPEDSKIRVSSLIKLWIAEGFLKPIHGKSMEMVAEEYLKGLINRNLVLVDKLGSTGKTKTCKIHDLLRDLCLRKALKERFLNVTKLDNISQDISTQRRICTPPISTRDDDFLSYILASPWIYNGQIVSLARSVIGKIYRILPLSRFRLLRVWNAIDTNYKLISYGDSNDERHPQAEIFQLVNLRYLAIRIFWYKNASFPYSVHLWNLQTLIVIESPTRFRRPYTFAAPLFNIWKMPQLRHVKFDKLDLLDPPMDGRNDFVLGNLETLMHLRNFKCGEEVVKRIPNIKKLGLVYEGLEEWSSCCLNNLGRLHKLESLGCIFTLKRPNQSYLVQNLNFPHSLKKLSLEGSHLNWEDMKTKIGALPLLQVLKLKWSSFIGSEWETVEGQFRSLQFLLIEFCFDLKYWTTDSTHFPRLEHLVLRGLYKLKEIPSCIGDISTLQSIELNGCSESAAISARKILDEQEELGNVGLQVRARFSRSSEAMKKLASDNFQI